MTQKKFPAILLSFILLIACLIPVYSNAVITEWEQHEGLEFRIVSSGYNEDNHLNLGLHFKPTDDWHIYWQNPGDAGTPPTITRLESENISDLPTILWPAPKRKIDIISDDYQLQSFIYDTETLLPVSYKVKDISKETIIDIEIDYALCKDVCIPMKDTFKLVIPPNYINTDISELIHSSVQKLPQKKLGMPHAELHTTESGDSRTYYIKIEDIKPEDPIKDVFILTEQNLRFLEPKLAAPNQYHIKYDMGFSNESPENTDANITVVRSSGTATEFHTNLGNAKVKELSTEETESTSPTSDTTDIHENTSLLLMLLYGLIGGFILNFMPCVLPVISLKLFGLVKQSGKDTLTIRKSVLTTTLGIITSFMILAGLVISLKQAGQTVGWGIHFQEPAFIIFMIFAMTIFATNLSGNYEINLPSRFSSWLANTPTNGRAGDFFTGAFATLLATPCTAPFLGVAAGFAVLHGAFEIISIFLAMSIGMALPYIAIFIAPRAVNLLPKPGQWMVNVRKVFAVFLILTIGWLLYVINSQIGFHSTVTLGLFSLILKFFLEHNDRHLSNFYVKIGALLLVSFLFFKIPLHLSEREIAHRAYIDSIWEPFDENRIDELVAQDKVVFIDITADWCATCKINKFLVLDRRLVLNMLKQEHIVPMRADITTPNENVIKYLNKKGRAGIPYNEVYGPGAKDGIILPTILTNDIVVNSLFRADRLDRDMIK